MIKKKIIEEDKRGTRMGRWDKKRQKKRETCEEEKGTRVIIKEDRVGELT